MASSAPVNQIWVGNIPYEATEEALREVMSSAGAVVSVRIRYDKESGQSKGFAFCEYENAESCALAVKHLNGTLFGGRTLRVDFCSSEQARPMYPDTIDWASGKRSAPLSALLHTSTPSGHPNSSSTNVTYGSSHLGALQSQNPRLKGIVPTGGGLQTLSNEDNSTRAEVCRIIESLTTAQLFYIMAHIQNLVIQAPDYSRQLLRENPSLCYAIIHALFICGMINEPIPEVSNTILLQYIYDDYNRRKKHLEDAKLFHARNTKDLQQQQQQQFTVANASLDASSGPSTTASLFPVQQLMSSGGHMSHNKSISQNNVIPPPPPNLRSLHTTNMTPELFTLQPSPLNPKPIAEHIGQSFPGHNKTWASSNMTEASILRQGLDNRMATMRNTTSQSHYTSAMQDAPCTNVEQHSTPPPLVPFDISSKGSAQGDHFEPPTSTQTHGLPTPAEEIINHMLNHPDVLRQLAQITPEQEALWTDKERADIMLIRKALEERGIKLT